MARYASNHLPRFRDKSIILLHLLRAVNGTTRASLALQRNCLFRRSCRPTQQGDLTPTAAIDHVPDAAERCGAC